MQQSSRQGSSIVLFTTVVVSVVAASLTFTSPVVADLPPDSIRTAGCVAVDGWESNEPIEVFADGGFFNPPGIWTTYDGSNSSTAKIASWSPFLTRAAEAGGPRFSTTFTTSDYRSVNQGSIPYQHDDDDLWVDVDGVPTGGLRITPDLRRPDYFDASSDAERAAALAADPPLRSANPVMLVFEVSADGESALAAFDDKQGLGRTLFYSGPGGLVGPLPLDDTSNIQAAGDSFFASGAVGGVAQIARVDAATGDFSILPHGLPVSASYRIADVTADGRYLSVSTAAGSWFRLDTDTGDVVPLSVNATGSIESDRTSSGHLTDDGNLFAFSYQGPFGANSREIYLRDVAAGTTAVYDNGGFRVGSPRLSTDGRFLTWSTEAGGYVIEDLITGERSQTALGFGFQQTDIVRDGDAYWALTRRDDTGSGNVELLRFDHPSSCTTGLRVAILGDSYISGEGTGDFIAGTDTEDNKCHRSTGSWAYQIATELTGGDESDIGFFACSGATTLDLYDAQYPSEEPGQLAALAAAHAQDPFDVVLVSIGGNDAGFADLITNCILGSCVYANEFTRQFDGTVFERRIAEALETIRSATDDEAAIYHMGYPSPVLPSQECAGTLHWLISSAEQSWINTFFLSDLNNDLAEAARLAGARFIDPQTWFADAGICADGERLANGARIGNDTGVEIPSPDEGALGLFLNTVLGVACDLGVSLCLLKDGVSFAEADSFHPTALGYDEMARRFRELYVDELGRIDLSLGESLTYSPVPPSTSMRTVTVVERLDDPSNPLTWSTPLRVSVTSPTAGLRLRVRVNSVPLFVADIVTDASGSAVAELVLPPGTPPGVHTIDVVDEEGRLIGSWAVTVEIPVECEPVGADDVDGDGVADPCDAEPGDGPLADPDDDGVLNAVDNCPLVANAAQTAGSDPSRGVACEVGTPGAFAALGADPPEPVPSTAVGDGSIVVSPEPEFDARFGTSVDASDDTLVVGEAGGFGEVHVYDLDAAGATFSTTLAYPGSSSGNARFGASVAVDGDRLAVGAPGSPSAVCGRVYVYERVGGEWAFVEEVVSPPVVSVSCGEGSRVELSGDTMVVRGAYGFRTYDLSSGSAVEVGDGVYYVVDGSTDVTIGPASGQRLSEDGQRFAIADSEFNVAVFDRAPDGGWDLFTRVAPSDTTPQGISFGADVAIAGDLLLVAAPFVIREFNGTSSFRDTAVYAFDLDAGGTATELARHLHGDLHASIGNDEPVPGLSFGYGGLLLRGERAYLGSSAGYPTMRFDPVSGVVDWLYDTLGSPGSNSRLGAVSDDLLVFAGSDQTAQGTPSRSGLVQLIGGLRSGVGSASGLACADQSGPELPEVCWVGSGPLGPDSFSTDIRVSADGQTAVFVTDERLLTSDTDGVHDLYVRDLTTGQLSNVTDGVDIRVSGAAISPDGSLLAFVTEDSTRPPTEQSDTYLVDRVAGSSQLVATDSGGIDLLAVADTGRMLFDAGGSVLVPAGSAQVVVVDPDGSATALPRTTIDGIEYVPGSNNTSLSADGSTVVVGLSGPGHAYGGAYDLATSSYEVFGVPADGALPNGGPSYTAVSGDGQVVAFLSSATNLVPDGGTTQSLFVYDRSSQELVRAVDGPVFITPGSLSADGSIIGFGSRIPSLDPERPASGAAGFDQYLYVLDRTTGDVVRVSDKIAGVDLGRAQFAPDSLSWVFESLIDLVLGDHDGGGRDVYATAATVLPTPPDTTPPTVVGAPDRAANANGWYDASVTITWTATDDSGPVTSPPPAVADLEGTNTYISDEVCDDQGNCAVGTLEVSADFTPPTIDVGTSSTANAAGWHAEPVTVTFGCDDAVSGIATCPDPVVLSSDLEAAVVTGTATDVAGNEAEVSSVPISIDLTPPEITATVTGPVPVDAWYAGDIVVEFSCSDALSGVATCPDPITLTDGADQSIVGTVTDIAGNSADVVVDDLDVDGGAPTITAVVEPEPNANGWNASVVTVTFECDDAVSGVASCSEPVELTEDGADQLVLGSVTDEAGNVTTTAVTVSIDTVDPELTLVAPADGSEVPADEYVPPECEAADALSGVNGECTLIVSDPTPVTGGDRLTATATAVDNAGNDVSVSSTYVVITDAFAPTIVAEPDRPSNSNGWWGAPVTWTFTCDDAASGVASCPDPVSLADDGAGQSFTVSALDNVGNEGVLTVAGVNIDSVPPTVAFDGQQPVYTDVDTIRISCIAADQLSGLDAADCPEVDQVAADFGFGPATITGSAVDLAGNEVSVSIDFVVTSPPRAVDDAETLDVETVVDLDVLGNDFDAEDDIDAGSVSIVTPPELGSATVNPDGTIRFVAGPIAGTAMLVYSIADLNGDTDTATVNVTITDVPTGACTIVGTGGNDLLIGTDGDDVICGRGGDDTIDGLGGDDVIRGGAGDDVIDAGDGDDIVIAGRGDDEVRGGNGDDVLRGGRGADTLVGEAGLDIIRGGAGPDLIVGSDGDDRLVGGNGPDWLEGGEGADIIRGGAGFDGLSGGPGDDRLSGNAGSDVLFGGAGDDVVSGGRGLDTASGGDGLDVCRAEIQLECELDP